jgi:protoheme IX farnesyltransferase
MMHSEESIQRVQKRPIGSLLHDFYELGKPRVVALIVFTAVVGMFLATPGLVPFSAIVWGTIGIGLAAASAAGFNQILDQRADAIMNRTRMRPLPQGQITTAEAVMFSGAIGILSMVVLYILVNPLTAVLTFLSLIGYSVIYTMYLKRATPQNIVIGGAAGAAPPVLGWTAVTGQIHYDSLLLFLIIFVWTPPHFWALALYRKDEYAKVGLPMLPIAYGEKLTRLHIFLYTVLLAAVTMLPFATRMAGGIYITGALLLNAGFLHYTWKLYKNYSDALARKTFGYSIQYLAVLFALLLIDHYRLVIVGSLQSALY